MSIYAELTFQILSALTSEKKQKGFERSEDVTTTTTRTDISEEMSGTREIADGASDEAVAFGGVTTAKILYIECDGELSFKFNGGSDSIKLTPGTGGQLAKVMWEGEFTSLAVSNGTGSTVTMTYFVAG